MPKVSIVTVSFNQAQFLERTLLSVLNQDFSDIEFILIDPGSTDGSRELIERYRSRIAHVVLEPDAGAADGLNKGFALATGEIYGFLNSDDVLRPGAVSAAVRYLNEHQKVDVVSGHAEIIDSQDRVLRRAFSDRMSIKQCVYGAVILIQPSTFFRRSAYQRTGGFNTQNRATWDGEFFLDMAMAGSRFGRSNAIWSGYRLHKSSITTSQRLIDVMNESLQKRFHRIVGRNPNSFDHLLESYYRVIRHLTNPRDTIERIMRGPVWGRDLD